MSLEIGARRPLLIRREAVGASGGAAPYRIVYLSDLHFRSDGSRALAEQVLEATRAARPDVVLLGGDLVDLPSGLRTLAWLVGETTKTAPVWAIRGNHDRLLARDTLRQTLEAAGGRWLEGESFTVARPGRRTIVVRGGGAPAPADPSAFRVLCAHRPDVFPAAAAQGDALVLAGHLHGGQCVLWERGGRMYPAAWFYRWNGLRFQRGDSTMIVSRGVSDTLPIRWNCPREAIVCEID